MAGFSSKIGHEIKCQTKEYGDAYFVGQVTHHRSYGFSERMIKCVFRMFFDNGTLGIKGQDLQILLM